MRLSRSTAAARRSAPRISRCDLSTRQTWETDCRPRSRHRVLCAKPTFGHSRDIRKDSAAAAVGAARPGARNRPPVDDVRLDFDDIDLDMFLRRPEPHGSRGGSSQPSTPRLIAGSTSAPSRAPARPPASAPSYSSLSVPIHDLSEVVRLGTFLTRRTGDSELQPDSRLFRESIELSADARTCRSPVGACRCRASGEGIGG
jgi:hypothetical protein